MAKNYIDYIEAENIEKQDLINAKIEILYDMAILTHKRGGTDAREEEVREMLSKCNSRPQMDILLHDVVRGKMSLDDLLDEGIVFLKGVN